MIRLVLLLAFVFSCSLSAQDSRVTIRAMSLDNADFPEIFLRGKGGYEPIRFSTIQPSTPFRAIAQNPLPIFYSVPSPEEGEKIKPDAMVKLPSTAGGVLLLAWGEGDNRNFAALPDNLGKGGSDNWLLVNATPEPIGFQLGDGTRPTVVEPGKSKTHRVTVKLGEGAAVTAAHINGEESKVIFSTYWTVFEDQRCVILFVQDGERVRVRQIQDMTAGEKVED